VTNLLLIEDDASLGATLQDRLRKSFTVQWARSCEEARKAAANSAFQLIIIDIGLPDGSGLDLARDLKRIREVPFIFLTAQNNAENRLKGYELGADEFIPKPFHLKELLLRIERVLSRHPAKTCAFTGVQVDLGSMSLTFDDGTTEYLAPRDFQLLQLLIKSAPRVVSRDEMLRNIFPGATSEDLPTHRTIDNSVVRLRQLLKRTGREYIRSVRGIGYQWVVG